MSNLGVAPCCNVIVVLCAFLPCFPAWEENQSRTSTICHVHLGLMWSSEICKASFFEVVELLGKEISVGLPQLVHVHFGSIWSSGASILLVVVQNLLSFLPVGFCAVCLLASEAAA
jgi:hypothetical protein